ncbi:MAG: hypothetical protein EZS28_042806 [Streblomastix strix]|uniref:Uncharacterized protein n=1 Tax=Streblomastix strix TaxID=222440 RepID=A0A5J4TTU2_9EUKA|nr:MAG: hypothetical protein EZS28_042806 [Streblomastix strix]
MSHRYYSGEYNTGFSLLNSLGQLPKDIEVDECREDALRGVEHKVNAQTLLTTARGAAVQRRSLRDQQQNPPLELFSRDQIPSLLSFNIVKYNQVLAALELHNKMSTGEVSEMLHPNNFCPFGETDAAF